MLSICTWQSYSSICSHGFWRTTSHHQESRDIGRELGITAVAAGKLLERLGSRSDKHLTDDAVATGCGIRRWDGYAIFDDWRLERAVAATRSAAQVPGEPAIADALAGAIGRQEARERVAASRREQEEAEAASRQEEEVISGLEVELRALCATDHGMSLLMAVEYVTPHPAHRIAHYRCCHAGDQSIIGMGQDEARLLKIASSVGKDLALLDRRAQPQGFQA